MTMRLTDEQLHWLRIGRRSRPLVVAGDKGYSYLSVRTWLAERGIMAVILTRSNQRRLALDCTLHRRRNMVERSYGANIHPRGNRERLGVDNVTASSRGRS